MIPLKPTLRALRHSALILISFFAGLSSARADLAADHAALTDGIEGQLIEQSGTAGGVAPFGRASFPVLLGTTAPVHAVMAAGRRGDSYAAGAARAVAWSHGDFFHTAGGARSTLFLNAVQWASRRAVPAGTVATVVSNSGVANFLTTAGYTVRSAGIALTAANLAGADVLVLSGYHDYSDTVMGLIADFTAAGGGLVLSTTTWASSLDSYADANNLLFPFGIVLVRTYSPDSSWTVAAAAPSPLYSALNAADSLIADREGTLPLTPAEKIIAANSISQVLPAWNDIPEILALLNALSDAEAFGWVTPTLAAPLTLAQNPVEKVLMLHQSRIFDALSPAELFVHPGAADFPGLPDAGAVPVSRTVTVDGNTPVDFYMNRGNEPTRVDTALYAPPGAVIRVTIPGNKISDGLQVQISGNGSDDTTFNRSSWNYFPKIWRRVDLTSTVTETGHVFGGLVTLLVPAGKSLGDFDVTIEGAIEAPVFVLGQTTDAEWNAGIKNRPAPYGYVQCDKLRIYLPEWQLESMDNPTQVVSHWQQVMDVTDEYYGYTPFRKRGEAVATSRYVSAGAGYAGYPIEAGWGASSEILLETARLKGDWGTYHELGHGYQDNFDGAFTIATNGEVDVNIMPAMLLTKLHDMTTWEFPDSFYGAVDRTSKKAAFLALPAAERTWAKACSFNDPAGAAYDFYFNLSDAFGWELYRTALGRLMRFLQVPTAATDAELFALNSADPNFKRNRFYLLFCDAAGRNLDEFFQLYGLGAPGGGFEITQSVKNLVAAKGYPVWNGNTDIDDLSTPPELSVSEDTPAGSEIYRFVATDAEEPGTIWNYQITAGNIDGAFSIDRRTGSLRVVRVDFNSQPSHTLTVQVQDNGVPRFSATRTFVVNVTDAPMPPLIEGGLFTATGAMADGTALGTVTAGIEPGRTLSAFEIVAGNNGNFVIGTTSGILSVTGAAALPSPGVIGLSIRATDSTGAVGHGMVTVLCNLATGVSEERWNSGRMVGAPDITAIFPSFTSPESVGSIYMRRASAWLVPSKTGNYTFWISSDDGSALYLSSDESPLNQKFICKVNRWTGYQEWTKEAGQKSAPVFLQAGRAYCIEARQTELGGNDHVSVAWEGPGIARQVIPSSALIPRNVTAVFPEPPPLPDVTISSPEEGAELLVPGISTVSVAIGANDLTITGVDFYDGETWIAKDTNPPYSVDWPNPALGPHTLSARVNHTTGSILSPIRSVMVAGVRPVLGECAIPTRVGLILESTIPADPPAGFTSTWSKMSGPGEVVFGNAASPQTTAKFSEDGLYILRLVASMGTFQTSSDLTVGVGDHPGNFINAAVGSPQPGSGVNQDGLFTISGNGSGNFGPSDNLHFYYQTETGDFDFRARLAGNSGFTALMARASLEPGAIHVAVTQLDQSNFLLCRLAANSPSNFNLGPFIETSAPVWQRLVRSGNSFTGYISEDGLIWSALGTATVALPDSIQLGFAVASGTFANPTAMNPVTYDSVSGFNPGNIGPSVDAGTDIATTSLGSILVGSVGDDGLPNPPAAMTSIWSQIGGPGIATFTDASQPATEVAFSDIGVYTLRLTASDGEIKTFSDARVLITKPMENWQAARFQANAGDPLIAGAGADPDFDGLSNLLEYALVTDPQVSSSPPAANMVESRLTLDFQRSTDATDLTLTVQGADSPSGPWEDLARSVAGGMFTAMHPEADVKETGTGNVRSVRIGDRFLITDPAHPLRFLRLNVRVD